MKAVKTQAERIIELEAEVKMLRADSRNLLDNGLLDPTVTPEEFEFDKVAEAYVNTTRELSK